MGCTPTRMRRCSPPPNLPPLGGGAGFPPPAGEGLGGRSPLKKKRFFNPLGVRRSRTAWMANVNRGSRRGGWGNRVAPRPRPAGGWGNPVSLPLRTGCARTFPRAGAWGNPVAPSPCGAGAWGNPVAPSPCARAAPAPSRGRGYGGTRFPHFHVSNFTPATFDRRTFHNSLV